MIGVVVDASEQSVVAEFFELFKTPWEFFRRGENYDVVLSTSKNSFCGTPQLALIFGGEATFFDAEHMISVKSRKGGFVVTKEGRRLPIYETMATFPASEHSVLKEESTQGSSAFAHRIGNTITLRIGYNLFDEVRFLLTVGQPSENAGIPTLEEHISLLRDWITVVGIPLVEIPPVPDGYSFITCLTHDIDHPALRKHWCDHTMFGFLYRATIGTWVSVCRGRKSLDSLLKNLKAACLLPFVHLGVARDFWSDFDRYLEMEAGHGSTYFVIPRSDYAGRTAGGLASPARACRYNVSDLLPQLKRIISANCEVGVHGVDAWLDADEGRGERETVSQALGLRELGVRMHWLFFDENSPALLERAGFAYDSTVGYCETVGYRAGTVQAYMPPGATTLFELPLHVMDTSLFYPSYLNLAEEEAERLVLDLIDNAERMGGAFTVNWHDRSISPERLWDDFYLRLLREVKSRGAWLPTAGQAVAWFRKRRSATVGSVRTESGVITVRGSMDVTDQLPRLRIRIHKPRPDPLAEPIPFGTPAEFVDVPFDNTTTQLSISL